MCAACGRALRRCPSWALPFNRVFCNRACQNSRAYQVRHFWERVDRSGDCWEWTGGRIQDGYGMLRFEKRAWLAHRLAYELSGGVLVRGREVMHSCDNPPCCNPAHLSVGTHQENMDDMMAKRRHLTIKGEAIHCAKLTEDNVREIRRLYADGADTSYRILAARFGVNKSVIAKVRAGETWKHVA